MLPKKIDAYFAANMKFLNGKVNISYCICHCI